MIFIDKCFKTVINKLVIKRPQITTVEKKTLILSLLYLGDISLQTRTKLRKLSHPLTSLPFCHMVLELKKGLLVKRDRTVLNKNISSAKLSLV